MKSATAILLAGRTLAGSALSGLGTASLAGPISPKTPFNTNIYVVFR